ncbi:MAG: hypothetical protein HY959_10140 [Ignavibacteriae bacterium]|nr:hypothetical protein [Ignavibacteriota bacterium]
MSQELIARWDGYLNKLRDRFYEVLNSTEEPMAGVIEGLQYDNIILINILNGLKYQTVTQLSAKADEGWSKMRLELQKINANSVIKEQAPKADIFKNWIDEEFQRYEIKLFARAANKILDNVKKHIDEKKMHRCTQCAAELPINVYSFMAVNLKCESCGSVNTYQPDDRIRALEYYVIEPLANEFAMEEKIKGYRDNNIQKEYWKKFFGYLMENVPDKKEYFQRTLDERLNNRFFSM